MVDGYIVGNEICEDHFIVVNEVSYTFAEDKCHNAHVSRAVSRLQKSRYVG